MTNEKIVIDTNTFVRGLAGVEIFYDAITRIKQECDRIVTSKKITKEYRGKLKAHGMPRYIFDNKLKELEIIKKLDRINTSFICARLRRYPDIRRCEEDSQDDKFLELAVVKGARYIITIDNHLLRMNPYTYGGNHRVEIIRPEEYNSDQ